MWKKMSKVLKKIHHQLSVFGIFVQYLPPISIKIQQPFHVFWVAYSSQEQY